MYKFSVLVCIFFYSFHILAQDSIPRWKPNFQLDNRISSIRDNSIVLVGAKLGLQYKQLTRIGIGASFILKPVEFEYVNKSTSEVITNRVDFWYFSIYNDWILYRRHDFEVIITEQIGYGQPKYARRIGNKEMNESRVDLYLNEISTQINYKINPIIGVGAGIGYRNLFNKKSLFNPTFDAPIYILKLIIYPRGLVEKLQKRRSNSADDI